MMGVHGAIRQAQSTITCGSRATEHLSCAVPRVLGRVTLRGGPTHSRGQRLASSGWRGQDSVSECRLRCDHGRDQGIVRASLAAGSADFDATTLQQAGANTELTHQGASGLLSAEAEADDLVKKELAGTNDRDGFWHRAERGCVCEDCKKLENTAGQSDRQHTSAGGRQSHGHERDKGGGRSSDRKDGGLVLEISGEMLGVFKYVEKLKRAKVKALAGVLKQVAMACLFLTVVRGVSGPLIEVFQSKPPQWSRLAKAISAVDYAAVGFLAMKARKPILQIAGLAFEQDSDAAASLEQQEEVMVTVATELLGLFLRLRNIIVILAFSQLTQQMYMALNLVNQEAVTHAINIIKAILLGPWGTR